MSWEERAQEYNRAKSREFYLANKAECLERSKNWHRDNRERRNALRHLLRLRAMKNPLPRHVRKMAEICKMFPKRRIVYI